uniref:Capsid protein n=1 Tax=Cressdnaviricota sp. TaxID=2748378 RepID=A0A6M4B6R7_9VIRU|nr:capsid protein [Cressdnaviricota sp.]
MTATNFAQAGYQEIIDLKTTTNTVSVIGLHTPTSMKPYTFLSGFFHQFSKYKYNGCSMALVPAARLPADISQVGYDAGEPPIDARDILNPVLFHGCHGNDMGRILDGFLNGPGGGSSFGDPRHTPSTEVYTAGMGDNAAFGDMYERLYYRALTDNTWAKANPQAGFRKRGLRPLVYDLSTNHAIAGNLPSKSTFIDPVVMNNRGVVLQSGQFGDSLDRDGSLYLKDTGLAGQMDIRDASSSESGAIISESVPFGSNYFTSRLHRLGWLDTTTRVPISDSEQAFAGLVPTENDINYFLQTHGNVPNALPLLFMGLILLPPAYKANQYMRLIINHSFSFKGFRGISTAPDYYAGLQFVGGENNAGGYHELPSE